MWDIYFIINTIQKTFNISFRIIVDFFLGFRGLRVTHVRHIITRIDFNRLSYTTLAIVLDSNDNPEYEIKYIQDDVEWESKLCNE